MTTQNDPHARRREGADSEQAEQASSSATQHSAEPVLDAYRTRLGHQLAVWCQHEMRWHRHGSVGPNAGDGDGDRAAHCSCPNSPLAPGYMIHEVGPFTAAVRRAHPREVRQPVALCCPTCEPKRGGRR